MNEHFQRPLQAASDHLIPSVRLSLCTVITNQIPAASPFAGFYLPAMCYKTHKACQPMEIEVKKARNNLAHETSEMMDLIFWRGRKRSQHETQRAEQPYTSLRAAKAGLGLRRNETLLRRVGCFYHLSP